MADLRQSVDVRYNAVESSVEFSYPSVTMPAGGRARPQAVWGREAASGHRPCHAQGRAHPGVRRGHVLAGLPDGGEDPGGPGSRDSRPHRHLHRAPPLHRPGRGPRPGAGPRRAS